MKTFSEELSSLPDEAVVLRCRAPRVGVDDGDHSLLQDSRTNHDDCSEAAETTEAPLPSSHMTVRRSSTRVGKVFPYRIRHPGCRNSHARQALEDWVRDGGKNNPSSQDVCVLKGNSWGVEGAQRSPVRARNPRSDAALVIAPDLLV